MFFYVNYQTYEEPKMDIC